MSYQEFKSEQTVKEVVEQLLQLPQGTYIGAFSPFDDNGPCQYMPLRFYINDAGQVEVNPQ